MACKALLEILLRTEKNVAAPMFMKSMANKCTLTFINGLIKLVRCIN